MQQCFSENPFDKSRTLHERHSGIQKVFRRLRSHGHSSPRAFLRMLTGQAGPVSYTLFLVGQARCLPTVSLLVPTHNGYAAYVHERHTAQIMSEAESRIV